MNIVVINQPIYNRGDESAHRCLINQLSDTFSDSKITVLFDIGKTESIENIRVSKPNVEYVIICNERRIPPEYGIKEKIRRKLCRILAFNSVKFNCYKLAAILPIYRKYTFHIKKADIIINAPGGIDLGGFRNWNDLFRLNLCKVYGKKIIYYARSIGPFNRKKAKDNLFADRCIQFLKSVDFLSLRDRKSIQIAEKENIAYIPTVDTAFLSVPDVPIPIEILEETGENYVVMVPNELTWHFKYKTQSQQQIDKLYKDICLMILDIYPTHNIVMIPQLYAYGKRGDYNYFKRLVKKIGDERIKVVNDKYSSDIQQSIIKKSTLVIGARYHTIIWAINNCRPFVSLSYEHKMTGILQELSAYDNSFDLEKCILEGWNVDKYLPVIRSMVLKAKSNDTLQKKAVYMAQKCYNAFLNVL